MTPREAINLSCTYYQRGRELPISMIDWCALIYVGDKLDCLTTFKHTGSVWTLDTRGIKTCVVAYPHGIPHLREEQWNDIGDAERVVLAGCNFIKKIIDVSWITTSDLRKNAALFEEGQRYDSSSRPFRYSRWIPEGTDLRSIDDFYILSMS